MHMRHKILLVILIVASCGVFSFSFADAPQERKELAELTELTNLTNLTEPSSTIPTQTPAHVASQSNTQFRVTNPSPAVPSQIDTPGLLDVTFGLFVVLIVIAAAAWLVRRFGNLQVTAKGNLKVIGGLHMGARERILLLQVGEQQLLVGVAPGRIQTLHVLPNPIAVDQQQTTLPNSFAEKLVAALKASKR